MSNHPEGMLMMRPTLLLICLATVATAASAEVHMATLNGDVSQTSTCADSMIPSTTQVIGTATYDDVTNILSWSHHYGDNSPDFDNGELYMNGSELASHWHGPVPPGMVDLVQINIGLGTPNIGSVDITAIETAEADLLNNEWYLNIHSAICLTGGEVRGYLLFAEPVPSISNTGMVFALGVLTWVGIWAIRTQRARPHLQ